MATLTCTHQPLIDGGGKFKLNAKDSEGNEVPTIIWAVDQTTQDTTDTITAESSLTFDSCITQNITCKSIADFLVDSGNFTL